jgi:hypothetical protein
MRIEDFFKKYGWRILSNHTSSLTWDRTYLWGNAPSTKDMVFVVSVLDTYVSVKRMMGDGTLSTEYPHPYLDMPDEYPNDIIRVSVHRSTTGVKFTVFTEDDI